MKRIASLVAAVAVLWGSSALALDLQEARAAGMVGETRAGYVAPILKGGEVHRLVSSVNLKRLEEYERISKENGQSVEVVAKLAYGQIVANLPSGAKYQDADGKWVTK